MLVNIVGKMHVEFDMEINVTEEELEVLKSAPLTIKHGTPAHIILDEKGVSEYMTCDVDYEIDYINSLDEEECN